MSTSSTDIILDDYDLSLINGDFAIGVSTAQEINLHIATCQGEWKQGPLIGAGLEEYINCESCEKDIIKAIKNSLKLDGKSYKVSIKEGQIYVEDN